MPSDDERRMLEDLLRVAARTHVPPLAVGANARFLVLDQRHSLPPQRATQDWDFAARFQSWQGYHEFAATLQAEGTFRRTAPPSFRS